MEIKKRKKVICNIDTMMKVVEMEAFCPVKSAGTRTRPVLAPRKASAASCGASRQTDQSPGTLLPPPTTPSSNYPETLIMDSRKCQLHLVTY